MGKIVGFDGKSFDSLTFIILAAFEADGSVSQRLESLTIPVEEWRRIARAVGRGLGRPVQTVVSPDSVHAVLRDWPANERERHIHKQTMRDIADAVALSNEVLVPIAPCPACGSERDWRPGDRVERSGSVLCPCCGLVEL